MSLKDKCAIVGVGYTPQGKLTDWTIRGLFLEAARNAVEDAGLNVKDIDGIIMEPCPNDTTINNTLFYNLQEDLGIETTRFCGNYYVMGATAGSAIQAAAMAINAGLASTVLCAYVEKSASAASIPYRSYLSTKAAPSAGPTANPTYGLIGPMPYYAMIARAHMLKYGTTSRQLGEVAVTFRKHACLNPRAQKRTPITIEDHQSSRMVVDPLHLLDICLVSDAGRAMIVTSAEKARSLRQPPIYIMGFGQGFVISDLRARPDLTATGAVPSGRQAFKMAGLTPEDIDVLWLYDATTYTVITQLEELGFCKPGEGGPFVENGTLSIGGKLPTNTSGGMLSEVYVQGWTGIPEIVSQLRGNCGERQVKGAEIGLVTAEGGLMNAHSTTILRR
jgi:acetyl-CoA acetyltransferase